MNETKKRKFKSCNNCNENDDYDDMVRCDHCEEWYHFQCAAVGPRIANLDWCCQVCLKKFAETYHLAKAAEDSIVRNLELKKRKQNKEQVESCTELSDEIEKIISKKVVETISQLFNDEGEISLQRDFGAAGAVGAVAAVIDTAEVTSVETEIDAVEFGDYREFGADGDVGGGACGGTDSGDVAREICGEVDIVCDFGKVSVVETIAVATDTVATQTIATQTIATQTIATLKETADAEPVPVPAEPLPVPAEPLPVPAEPLPVPAEPEIESVEFGVVGDVVDEGGGACGGTDAATVDAADECTSVILPIEAPDDVAKFEFELEEKLDDFNKKYKNKGDKKLATTMRNVSNRIIDDDILKDYSYDGKRGKKPFNVYTNIIKLIVQSTMDSYNNHNIDTAKFTKITYNEVHIFFKDSFLKFAPQRAKRK